MLDTLAQLAHYPLTLGHAIIFYFAYQFAALVCDIARHETPNERDARRARKAKGPQ